MNLDKHELKLLVAALAVAPAGDAVKLAVFAGVFDRPAKLNGTVASLNRCGAVLWDQYQAVLRVRPAVIWKMLNEFGDQTELFTNERPLDAVLARVPVAAVVNITNPCDLTRSACEITRDVPRDCPRPKPPEPPPPDGGKPQGSCAIHAFHAPHVMPQFMPDHAPKPATPGGESSRVSHVHVHEHVISGNLKELHEHEHGGEPPLAKVQTGATGAGHEVGELSRRTTEQMMADIARLAPGLLPAHAEHWRRRIEVEDAAAVNAVIRQAQLQRRGIRNVAGWMNACYLRAMSPEEVKP